MRSESEKIAKSDSVKGSRCSMAVEYTKLKIIAREAAGRLIGTS
jgi:hypothetical protein